MTDSKIDIDELKELQREAAEQRAEREKQRKSAEKAKQARQAEKENLQQSAAAAAARNDSAESADPEESGDAQASAEEVTIQEFVDQLGSVVVQIENAARERPALALLTAFTVGIIVGRVFSRK